jgi:hypothetical protein
VGKNGAWREWGKSERGNFGNEQVNMGEIDCVVFTYGDVN